MKKNNSLTTTLKLVCGIAGLFAIVLSTAANAQPTFSKVFSPDTIGPGSVSTLTFTIDNAAGTPVSMLDFTDVLPTDVIIATPAAATSTCSTPTITAPDGGGTIAFSDAAVAGFSSCTVSINVTSATAGMHANVSGDLTSDAGNSGTASDDLTVNTERPGFSKNFAPPAINVGDRSTLTFTIDNSANAAALSSLLFTDNLPTGILIASPSNATTNCGGSSPTLTATPGTGVVSFSSFGILFPGFEVLLAGAMCTVTVDVTTTGAGTLVNVSGDLTSNVGSSGMASDVLTVMAEELVFTKSFTDDPVAPGTTVTLQFNLTNTNRLNVATGITFSDNLDATLTGLTAASVDKNTCGGTVDIVTDPSIVDVSGASLGESDTCEIVLTLSVPMGAMEGAYPNTTSTISASTGTFNAASETLFVQAVPVLSKSFTDDPVAAGGTTTLEFTITNPSPVLDATDITFFDDFNSILQTASAIPASDFCGAGSTVSFTPLFDPPGGSVVPARLSVSGANLLAGTSCTFSITLDVIPGAPAGTYTNTTSAITGTLNGTTRTGDQAADDLIVIGAPTLTKEFTDDPVLPGAPVTLQFTISQHALAPGNASAIVFTDDLDASLTGLTATSVDFNDCGATVDIMTDPSVIDVSGGGPLAPGASCNITVSLLVPAAALPGSHQNTTSDITANADNGMAGTVAVTGNPAQNDLIVSGLTLSKSFTDDPVLPGGTVTLEFTIDNTLSAVAANNMVFIDNLADVLPGASDLTITSPLPLVDPCGASSSLSGSTFLVFTGGNLAAGATCTFSVTVSVPAGTADGSYINTTSNLTADIGASPGVSLPAASDALTIESGLLYGTKSFTDDPTESGGTVTLEFDITNGNPADITDIAFTDDLDATLNGLVAAGLPATTCGGTLSGTGLLSFTGGSLAAGASCTISVTLQVPVAATAGDYTNTTSTLTGTLPGPLPVIQNPMSDTLTVTQPSPYTDVPNTHPQFESILALYNADIATGSGGEFYPDQIATRDLAAIWLWRAKNNPVAPTAAIVPVYDDVQVGDFAADWILGIKTEAITEGCDASATSYCPKQVLTKAQAAIMLLKAGNVSPVIDSGSVYNDVPDDHYAADWIRTMKFYRFSEGCDTNNYCPDEALTLAGFANLLAKVFALVP